MHLIILSFIYYLISFYDMEKYQFSSSIYLTIAWKSYCNNIVREFESCSDINIDDLKK